MSNLAACNTTFLATGRLIWVPAIPAVLVTLRTTRRRRRRQRQRDGWASAREAVLPRADQILPAHPTFVAVDVAAIANAEPTPTSATAAPNTSIITARSMIAVPIVTAALLLFFFLSFSFCFPTQHRTHEAVNVAI